MADPRVVAPLPEGVDPRVVAPMEPGVTAQDRDIAITRDASSEFTKGLRAGFNGMGAGANALVGHLSETLGLTDFAASRFAEADAYAKFADQVGPAVNDYRQIKDMSSLIDFATGALGNAAASFAPSVLGGVGGAAVGGLRGAMVGLGAGSFVPNAGEQAQKVRSLPGTPGEKLANSLAVGGVNALLDTAATGRVAKQIAQPTLKGGLRAAVREGAKTTLTEGGTEGLQDVVGQVGEMALDPSKQLDPHSAINSALQGAIGGAGLATAGHVASIAPGALSDAARGAQEFAQSARGKLEAKLGHIPDVKDENDLSDIVNNPDLKDPEQILAAIDKNDGEVDINLQRIGQMMGRTAAQVDDLIRNPESRGKFVEDAKQWVNDTKIAPRVRGAFERTKQAFNEAAEAAKQAYGEERGRKSLSRTGLDDQIHDFVRSRIPEKTLTNLSPQQRLELSDFVKNAAMYTMGTRGEAKRSTDDAAITQAMENDRGPQRNPIPAELVALLGGYDAAHGTLQGVSDILARSGAYEGRVRYRGEANGGRVGQADVAPPSTDVDTVNVRAQRDAARRARITAALGRTKGFARMHRDELGEVIRSEMKPEYQDDPELREAAVRGFSRMLHETDMPPIGALALEDPKEPNQRLAPGARKLMEAAGYIFADRPRALRRIEAAMERSIYLTEHEEGSIGAPPPKTALEEAFDEAMPATDIENEASHKEFEDFERQEEAKASPYNDERLRTYSNIEEARQVFRDLTNPKGEYDQSKVAFRHMRNEDGTITLYAVDRDGSAELTGRPAKERGGRIIEGSGDWNEITDKSPGRQAGFEHGTITVKRNDGETVRVSLKALSKWAVRTLDRPGDSATYPRDVVLHGLSALMADPSVASIHEKGNLPPLNEGGQWTFPDDTVMATIGNREYTWGEISKMRDDPHGDQAFVDRQVERAQQYSSIPDARTEGTLRSGIAKRRKKISADLDKIKEQMDALRNDMPKHVNHEAVLDAKDAMEEAGEAAKKAVEAAKKTRAAYDADNSPANQAAHRAAKRAAREAVLAARQAEDALHRAEAAVVGARAHNKRVYPEWTDKKKKEAYAKLDALKAERSALRQRRGKMDAGLTALEREFERRRMNEDRPLGEMGSRAPDYVPPSEEAQRRHAVGKDPRSSSERAADPRGSRLVDEQTGEMVQGDPRRRNRRGYEPHEVGQRPEDRASGPVTITKPGEQAKAPAKKPEPVGEVLTQEQEGLYRAAKEFVGEEKARQLIAGLRADAAMVASGRLPERQRNEAGGRLATAKRLLERGGNSEWKQGQLDHLLKVFDMAHAEWGKRKFSDLRVNGTERISPEKKEEIRQYITRVLGPKAKTFFKNLDHAGEWANMDGVDVVQIANLALDHFGAARHEAAHGLMKRLLESDKKTAQTLLAAASSPIVSARLRDRLKDHPAALKQLADPEERLAYMYQFWAGGDEGFKKLSPATKTIFDKVKAFFRSVAGIWSETFSDQQNIDKALQVFEIFDRGDLANPNTVREVLHDKMPRKVVDHLTEAMPQVRNWLEKTFYTSDGYIRAMNVPAFNAVLDEFFSPMGKDDAKPGFNQAKHQAANRFLTRVVDILEGASEEAQREALEALQRGEEPKSAVAKAIVNNVRPLLRDVFDYMKDSSVKAVVWDPNAPSETGRGRGAYVEKDVNFVEKYFPRFYDRAAIAENRQAFIAMLMRNKFKEADANELADTLMRSQPASPTENDELAGLTYYAPNTQARSLDIPADQLAPYLRKDLFGTLSEYINYTVRRAEYAKRFGNQGQEIAKAIKTAAAEQGATTQQINDFNQAVQAWEGSLGNNINADVKKVMGAVLTYQNIRLLPLALFSSLVDPVGIAVRGGSAGEAFGAFVRGIRGLVTDSKDHAQELAETVGAVSRALETHMMADAYGSQYMTPLQRKVSNAFFKWNGMESWNRSMRIAATAAGERFIIRHATNPTEHSERYLRELGITKDDVRVDAQGNLDVSSLKMKGALNFFVDGAVLRPNAHLRPIWMSDPHWMLVSHLKQFTYSFQKTIIGRVMHEAEHGNWTPALALASYVPAIIAADAMRAMLTPGGADDDRFKRLDLSQVMWRGIQRAGLVGPGQYALDAYGDLGHGKAPLTSLGGPTFQQLMDFGTAAAGRGGSIGDELMKGIPGQQMFR